MSCTTTSGITALRIFCCLLLIFGFGCVLEAGGFAVASSCRAQEKPDDETEEQEQEAPEKSESEDKGDAEDAESEDANSDDADKKDSTKKKPVGKDIWLVNVDEALELSVKDGKTVFVLFTGSDWCPPCMKLESDVFDTDVFKKQAVESYQLVKLDFPRASETPEHNEEWSNKLSVSGFPTVILLDIEGRPFAKTGFQEGGPEEYLKHLEELRQVLLARDEAFVKAEELKGDERATALDEGLSAIPEEFVADHYEDVIREIVELDSKDKLGLRTKYWAAKDKEARKEIIAKIAMAARTLKAEKAVAEIDKALNEMTLPAMMKIDAMQYKLRLLRKMKRKEQANSLLDEMILQEGVEAEITNRLIVQKAYFLVSTNAPDEAISMLEKRIGSSLNNLELVIGKGELLDRLGKHEEAIVEFDLAIETIDGDSEKLAEVLGLKSEALIALDRLDEAIAIIDKFASDDEAHPPYLRADAFVQKAVLLREADRGEAADLAEKNALALVEDPAERETMLKYIEQLKSIGN